MPVNDLKLSYAPATHEDVSVIFAMAKDLIDTYEDVAAIDYDKVIQWVFHKICRCITDYQCIFADGVKVGYYHLAMEDGEAELDDLYILPEFQGTGLGTAVLNRCITETPTPVFLYVFKRNERAIKLYSRMGFSVSQEVRNTRYIMRREVDRPTAQVYNRDI